MRLAVSKLWRGRLCALALALFAASSFSSPSRVAAQATDTLIRVGVAPNDDSMPLIYAAHAGLFKQAGLNVDLQKFSGGAVVAAALAGGSLEIGKGTSASVIAAYAKGLPFTIIGSISYYNADNPGVALIILADSDIKVPKDLAGKTLGAVTLQDLGTLATFAWLDQHGVDWKSLKFLEIPQSAALASMQASRIVGMPVYEPIFSADLATGKVRVLGYPFDAIARHFAEDVMFANVSWVGGHRDLIQRFLRVVREASIYVGAHESEMVPILAQFSGADPALLARLHHPGRGVAIVPSDLQPLIDINVKFNIIQKRFLAQDLICSCAVRR
jgi:NitT/TauT family transport system substrate-binding protein